MLEVINSLYKRYFSEEEAIIFTVLLVLGTVLILTLGGLIAPVLWSLVLTFLLRGPVNWLVRNSFSYTWAFYLVYTVFLSFAILIFFVLLPFSWSRLIEFINELPYMMNQLQAVLLLLPENYPEVFSEEQVRAWIASMQRELNQYGQFVLSYSVSGITRVIAFVVYTVLVPILVFFMLKDSVKLLAWLENWLPEKRPVMAQIWHEMNDQLGNYIRGKVFEMIIVGSVAYLAFIFFDLNHPILLAIVVGISVIIPYIGAVLVTVPVFLVAFFQWGFSAELYQLMLVYAVIQILDGNVLVPLIFSETVNLHPVAIITAVLFFGGIWGVWGVFFAIPIATFIKAIIRAWPVSPLGGQAADKTAVITTDTTLDGQ